MIARILLLLLVLASLPAMAAGRGCHQGMLAATRAMVAMPGMPAHHDGAAAVEHRCIGCMPLPEAFAARIGMLASSVRLPRPIPARFDLRAAGPPALRPPRIG